METWGLVDESGLITEFPADLEESGVFLELYPDTESAEAALHSEEISVYYFFPADLIESGEYYLVTPDFNPLDGASNNWAIDWVLTFNMVGGDELCQPGAVSDDREPHFPLP